MWKKLAFTLLLINLAGGLTRAEIIYQETSPDGHLIPLGPDDTPGRPIGDHVGNQITVAGTQRVVNGALVGFGATSSTGTIAPQVDDYTLAFYLNDGPGGAPGTLFASSTVSASDAAGVFSVFFPLHVIVPETFTAVVSSTHPTDTFSSDVGVVGPLTADAPPSVGSALNGVWYGTGSPGSWQFDSTWALNQSTTNYIYLALSAVPEPSGLTLMAVAGAVTLLCSARRRLGRLA